MFCMNPPIILITGGTNGIGKQAETRTRRIGKTVQMLEAGNESPKA